MWSEGERRQTCTAWGPRTLQVRRKVKISLSPSLDVSGRVASLSHVKGGVAESMGPAYRPLQTLPRGAHRKELTFVGDDLKVAYAPQQCDNVKESVHLESRVWLWALAAHVEALSNMELIQKGCAGLFIAALVGAQTQLAPNLLCYPQKTGNAWECWNDRGFR